MQWGARLIATPLGKTNLERTLARERRMLSAEGKMRSLMGVLVWTLLLSIGFFVLGFLIQFWELAFSFAGSTPILVIGGVIATGLTLIILGIIMVTTIHAALNDNSPFESPLSNAMKPLLVWTHHRVWHQGHSHTTADDGENDEPDGTKDMEDVGGLIQWNKDDGTNILALKTYAKLVLNTNDVEVLERSVPSFEIGEWYAARDSLLPVFHAVRERLLATDTSFRVKETVHKQLVYFIDWEGWNALEEDGRRDLKANDFTRWCRAQCPKLINSLRGFRHDFFLPFAFFASLEEDNADLRDYTLDSHEECVAGILCTFNSDRELGDRKDIFECAVDTCDGLLFDGRTDDITAILSHVNPASLLCSLIRNPRTPWYWIRGLVTFITKGKEVEILDEMSNFFSNLPEMSVALDQGDPLLVCQFLEFIIDEYPSDFATPHSLDLAPVLDLVHLNSGFYRYSKTLACYLTRDGLNSLSDLRPALKLWEYCRDVHRNQETLGEVVAFYQNYNCCFIRERCLVLRKLDLTMSLALPPPSSEELDDLTHNICTLIARLDDPMVSVKVFKRPILELLDLDSEQRNTTLTRILEDVQRSDFVTLLIMKSRLPWTCVQDLVLSAAKNHEVEILTAIGDPDIFNLPSHTISVFLDFLGHLVFSLPSDFIVPPSLNLSRVMHAIVRREHKRQTWRKHTATIITYLDHGAFDNIDRDHLDDVARFFNLCIAGSQKMREWDDAERPSEHTQQRAMFYLEELKVRAAQNPST